MTTDYVSETEAVILLAADKLCKEISQRLHSATYESSVAIEAAKLARTAEAFNAASEALGHAEITRQVYVIGMRANPTDPAEPQSLRVAPETAA